MNENFRYFPYIIRDIVSNVRLEYSATEELPNGITPVYEFGTYLELTKQVAIKDRIDAQKYPLIWLVWEASESVQTWINELSYNVRPRIFICNFTNSDYSSIERYETNFINILFPIWEIFKEYLKFNKFVSTSTTWNFQLTEHLLWGESLGFQKNANVLFDTLDAIEIKFENLEINKIC